MANSEDVVVKFRADVSESISEMDRMKQSVVNTGKAVEQTNTKIQASTKKTVSSFNGLGHSINQLSRELPAFAVSANVGFMALSNNIPMLADEINKLKAQNLELTKSGKQAIPVWKSLTGALFGWQTLLSVGVTLLTLYGGKIFEWVKGMVSAKESLVNITNAQKEYNSITGKATENILKEKAQLLILLETAKDVSKSYGQRKGAVDELQRLYPSYLKNLSDEQIMNGNITKEVNNLTTALLRKAKAEIAVKQIVENEKTINTLRSEADVIYAKIKALDIENEKRKAQNKTEGASQRLIEGNNRNIKENRKEQNKLLDEYSSKLYDVGALTKINNDLLKIGTEGTGLFNKELGDGASKLNKDLTEREKILEKIAKLEVKIQNSVILKGTYNEKDKEALRDQLNLLHQIDEEYAMILDSIGDIQKIEFKQNDGGLAEFRKGEESKTKVKADELKKQNDAFNEFQAKEREENIKNREEFKKVVIDSAYQLSGSYLDITNNFTQSHIDSITSAKEANIAQIDDLLERGLLSQKEYDDKKAKLENTADSATRKLLLKQFEREKAVNTARAIMDGILAVQKAYAELGPIFGLPAAIIVGGIATANVVAIQTQPTPKFEDGGHVKGKRHSQGGVLAELEDGEFVNKRKSVSLYREYLEGANDLKLKEVINKNDVIPALRKQREKILSNISSNFNDGNILNSDRETRGVLRDIYKEIKKGKQRNNLRFKNV